MNECPRRDAAGALAGAILGANWGKSRIPFRFLRPIKGDVLVYDISKAFVDTFFIWGGKFYSGFRTSRRATKRRDSNPSRNELKGAEGAMSEERSNPGTNAALGMDRPRPSLLFVNCRKIKCSHWVTAVRDRALADRYPGGVQAFGMKHHGLSNGEITVMRDMGSDLNGYFADLIKHGLVEGEDFVIVDTTSVLMPLVNGGGYDGSPYAIETGADWLKCEYEDRKIHVWYEECAGLNDSF